MSNPRTKRQFAGAASDPAQRQITAFFGKTTPGASTTAATAARPVLPAETESNLLTVGMRVRKSVPEGYKTGSYCALGLFEDYNSQNNIISERPATANTTTARAMPISTPFFTTTQPPRELAPFCAINNIGGLPTQPTITTTQPLVFHGAVQPPAFDDIPSLSSSQDSISSSYYSTSSSTSTLRPSLSSRKRSHDDDTSYGFDNIPYKSTSLQVPSGEWMDGQVSPRSLVPVGEQWRNTRVMAVPKRSVTATRQSLKPVRSSGPRVAGEVKGWAEMMMGQENVVDMMITDDFPEADFLDPAVLEGDAMELS